jgi:two-component system, OmpR family, phosphate regulon response regulator PhoB
MPRVLVIEDETDLRELLEYNLKGAGYEVSSAADAATGVAMARDRRPDLVLLDIMLPDASGLDVCRMLKSNPATRDVQVMMVTAKGEEIDRVVGFELGADDYVVKPFSTRELLLRVQAVLRRRATAPMPVREGDAEGPIRFGVLLMDKSAHRAWVDDAEVQLTALEFKLLGTLYERRDRVQTRGSLLEDVWGASAEMATRTVDTHVKRLREKLGRAGDYIETVRGVGYRFVARPEDAAADGNRDGD